MLLFGVTNSDQTGVRGQTFTLTFPDFNVFKSHLGPRVADQHFAVEREHDVHLSQINHAANYIPGLPLTTKWLIANVPPLSLKKGYTNKSSSEYYFRYPLKLIHINKTENS